MDYSDKIQTHVDALRHYLLAQAESNDPFISQRDRNERISRDILIASSMRRGMFVSDIPDMNPGFSSFISRFSPIFTLDWDSELMDEISVLSHFARPFQIMINTSAGNDNHRLSITPDDKDFLEKADKLARILATFEKHESNDNGIRVTFDAYQYIQDKRESLVRDLFSRSVIHYKGDSAPTSDSSPANVEKVNQILMDAIYSSYPKNIAPDDLDGAMVHVIQACDNERRKMIISEYYAYEEFFKAYPYCWSDHLIRKTWEISLEEEIITECDTD